jgi:hypothetical protein
MMEIRNFSRHPFSTDQAKALRKVFGEVVLGEPEAPFFKDAEDFASKISGTVASAIVPMEILLDALSEGLLNDETTLITWRADQDARNRGRFASRNVSICRLMGGKWEKTHSESLEPTVEVSFKDGKEFPYGTPSDKT